MARAKHPVDPALSAKRRAAGLKGGHALQEKLRAAGKTPPLPPPPPPAVPIEMPKLSPEEEKDPQKVIAATLAGLMNYFRVCPADERPKVANAITSQTNLLAKLTGSLEVSHIQLMRSKAWRDLKAILVEVLDRRCPEAWAEIAAELEKWEKR